MAKTVQTKKETMWTPANIVTLVRICLVPVFVVALISPWPDWFNVPHLRGSTQSFIAAGLFILISCTDWIDGYLARSRNEVTDFGKFMDPLADKILVIAALLVLVELGALPSWVVLIIVAREFIVSGVRMVAASKGFVIAASWYGKAKTVFQMIAIVLFTVKDTDFMRSIGPDFYQGLYIFSWIIMTIALVLTIVSMLDYIAKARHLFKPGSENKSVQKDGKHKLGEPERSEAFEQEEDSLAALAKTVVEAAQSHGICIATAESLTGGLISATLTSIPGSSEVVKGGIVSYTNEIKAHLLSVEQTTLDTQGAVSSETASEMALGARKALNVGIAVSVTGIAGPTGAEPGKPVGTVWLGLSTPSTTKTKNFLFDGNREEVRRQTCEAALNALLEGIALMQS